MEVKSITSSVQTLYLDGEKAELLKGKRVLIVDDVISTGESLRALEKLTESADGIIVGKKRQFLQRVMQLIGKIFFS